jgi:metal-responsive CopG/Arc/MetJ family transcriptional regulator
MFGGPKIKLDKDLMERLTKVASASGYSSVDEFVKHVLEKELAAIDDGGSEEEIKKKLEGLGYMS